MINETGDQATELGEIAVKYIDVLADRAKAIVAIASPFAGEIAIAAGYLRGFAGVRTPDRHEAPGDGCAPAAMSLGALGYQVKRHPLASLALVTALAAAGYYIARRR